MPEALRSPFLIPHVAAYLVSYVIFILAAFGVKRHWMRFGFFAMTLGLVLGATWGKFCWGDFWQYDVKETSSLVTWLVYLVYFSRAWSPRTERFLRRLGAVLIVVTLALPHVEHTDFPIWR